MPTHFHRHRIEAADETRGKPAYGAPARDDGRGQKAIPAGRNHNTPRQMVDRSSH